MSAYKSTGTDFDALFDPDVIGDGPAAAGYKQSGTPLKYAALKYGTKGPNCGYAQAGVDVSNLWAAKGTAVYERVLPDPGYQPLTTFIGTQFGGSSMWISARLDMLRDGTWIVQTNNSLANNPVTFSGDWFDPPRATAGDVYQVMFTPTLTNPAGTQVNNTASTWAALSATRAFEVVLNGKQNDNKSVTGTVRVRIRRASDGVVLSDVNVNVNVELNAGA